MEIKIIVENTGYMPVEDKRATIFVDGEKRESGEGVGEEEALYSAFLLSRMDFDKNTLDFDIYEFAKSNGMKIDIEEDKETEVKTYILNKGE